MNASVTNVLKSLQAAPLLTSLPNTVLQVQVSKSRKSTRPVVLKLGVVTLLRVANCQKRVAKFDKTLNLTYIAENMAKIRVLKCNFHI